MTVIFDRDGGDLDRTRRLGAARFEQAVRREITKRGGQKPSLRILRNLFTALADPAGVLAHRRGALERVQLLLEDWRHNHHKLADTEQRMTQVLHELELTDLVTLITGISAVGAATILAETGRPEPVRHRPTPWSSTPASPPPEAVRHLRRPHQAHRPRTATTPGRCLAHGLASATSQTLSTVPADRHLTTREHNKLKPTQAQTVIAAAILRRLHAVITTGQAWDPNIATHGTRRPIKTELAA